ncbi:MAG: beta strand repeat-containing protein, partial [Chitinophagaceae bacterium]
MAFPVGYLGTQGTSTNKANIIKTFSTLEISRAAFVQTDVNGDGLFGDGGTQGNDLAGRIKIYLSSGTVITLNGALNWRETTGSKVEVMGFIFDPGQNAVINYSGGTYNIVGGTTANSSTTLGLRSYFSTFTFTDNENRAGNAATSGLLDALNAELLNTPQPTFTLSPNSVTEGQNLVYNVTLGPVPNQNYPFVFSLTGTATNGTDYNSLLTFSNGVINNGDGTITVPTGVSSFTVTVATIDDVLVESTETITLTIGAKSATGNVLDNDATVSGGSIGASQTICTGTAPAALTSEAAATTGATYQWQSSTDNVTFTDIASATSAGYTPGTLTTTTYYRRKATIAADFDYSNVVTITVNPIPSAPASITGNLIVTSGSSQSYTAADVTGASAYTWTAPSGWTGTSITSTITLTAGSTGGTLSVTATVGGCTSPSRSITVSVLSGGTIGTNQSICSGATPTALSSIDLADPAAGSNYQWQSSSDNINFNDIASANNINYAPGALTATTYYRRKVTNGSGVAYSNTVTVTVNPLPAAPASISGALVVVSGTAETYTAASVATATSYTWTAPAGWTGSSTTASISLTPNATGGTLSVVANDANGCTSTPTSITISVLSGGTVGSNQTICAGTIPSAFTSTADATPASGSTYQWQSSLDNTSFTDIATATAATYTPASALSTTTYYRRKVTNGTAVTYSNVITVTVTPTPAAPASISGDLAVVASGSFTYTAATVAGATSYNWTLPAGWTGSSTTNSITATAGSAGGVISVTASAGTCTSGSTSITVSMLNGGTIGSNQIICAGATPATFTSTTAASPAAGSVYQWQSSTDNSNFTDIASAISETYTQSSSLSTTTYYRRKVTNGTAVTYSNTIIVTVNPIPAAPANISGALVVVTGTAE